MVMLYRLLNWPKCSCNKVVSFVKCNILQSQASSSQGDATALETQRNEEEEESRVEYYVPEVVLVRKK